MNEPRSLGLDFVADDTLTGFRLQRLEVFNWGTFDGEVWVFRLDGRNALLTGDIGSGKSTLVDAITTLLIPANKIAYNKAAGADNKERSLRSYVQGDYKSERHEVTGAVRSVSLRDRNAFSVILGVFYNAGYDQFITLAQVFWTKDKQTQPARFYCAAEKELSIAGDFSSFGADLNQLRRRLRNQDVQIEDSFPKYGAWFRRRFGIENEQAMELFHQTVSMKSVGNLTEFVRTHMLEAFNVKPRLEALIGHFDDLNRAHEAVLKAKRQVELLCPLVEDCDRRQQLEEEIADLRGCREALRPYFASLKLELLDRRLENIAAEQKRLQLKEQQAIESRAAKRRDVDSLRAAVAEHGGDRVEQLSAQIAEQEAALTRRKTRFERYTQQVSAIEHLPVQNEKDFLALEQKLASMREDLSTREADLQNSLNELNVAFQQKNQERASLVEEIDSLKSRRSNIGKQHIGIRQALCEAVGVSEDAMPFAGELLQVREDEQEWEGASERVLHNFALSLLIQDEVYPDVAAWVDRTNLRGRLVYFRVRTTKSGDLPLLHPESLVRKLAIKPDSEFYPWLEREVAHRFDYACCANQEQFRRETKALTQAGQIKARGERHEKDDRRRLDDRSLYVLGWTNTGKIAALQNIVTGLERELADTGGRISQLQQQLTGIGENKQALAKLEEFDDYTELDWQSCVSSIERMKEEKIRLESSNDQLRELNAQLASAQSELERVELSLSGLQRDAGKLEEKHESAGALRAETVPKRADPPLRQELIDTLEALRNQELSTQQLSVESCDNRESELRDHLQGRLDAEVKRMDRLTQNIVSAMTSFKNQYTQDTSEFDNRLEAAYEYRALLDRLNSDDLPRFEARFKELLNQNTIVEIANFSAQLAKEREEIKERIDFINESLIQIDYNSGRYIRLELQPTPDADIRDFQSELRACTDDSISGSQDDQYSEAKFLQVKAIIDRFRGREGLSDLDRRWTEKVTDVRNWFLFAASERWREDDSEHEHYAGSGGKSGGQKEKLAYTVLAASLAYQFGLEWDTVRSRTFRFVVIDEAFGRGSDESTQYGLTLFAKLNLQLLIVTPLQKIHVIESYVSNVGFIQNKNGQRSMLRNLTIEEYREQKSQKLA
ncbi:MAG: ATP-binding protein [Pseudohongiellaceae bacterium]